MTDVKTFLFQPLLRLIGVCALPLVLIPLLHYLGIAAFGSDIFLWLQIFIHLPFMAALVALVVSPFFLVIRRFRAFALRVLIASAVLTASVFIGVRVGWRIRVAAFHRLAERSVPLVQTIRSCESRYGTSPSELPALVPDFLSTIPGTGMAAYPRYEYYVGVKAADYDANPWVLVVFTPSGGLNWDQFMYFPLQNYPKTGYGGRLERISDWAYLHE